MSTNSIPLRVGHGASKARRAALSRYFVAPMAEDCEESGQSYEASVCGQSGMVDQGIVKHQMDEESMVRCKILIEDGQGGEILVGSVGIPKGRSNLWSGWIIGDRKTGSPLVVCSVVGSETFED